MSMQFGPQTTPFGDWWNAESTVAARDDPNEPRRNFLTRGRPDFSFGLFGEEEPEYGFAQYLNMFGQQDPVRDWLSRNYGQTRQNYQGQYMSALSSGQETPSWLNFLQNYDPYKAYSYASPRERGENPGAFTGRTRSIY